MADITYSQSPSELYQTKRTSIAFMKPAFTVHITFYDPKNDSHINKYIHIKKL